MKTVTKTLLLAIAALGLSACGGLAGTGQTCTQNQECGVNLACVEVLKSGATGCTGSGAKICTKKCAADNECYGAASRCKAACNGELLCTVP